ncbi:MAG: carbohydrate ABC transporter permease, partial [Jiangellaceae bacterium]
EQFAGRSWLISPLSFYFVATVIVVWMSVPFVAFSVFAGLTQVPTDTIEAAQIDGAGAWQRFWTITVPMIKPVLLIVGLLQIIWDLRVFTQIFVLQDAGGVARDTNLIGTYIYRLGIGEGQFGLAAAASWFILVLTVVVSFFYVRVLLREEEL